MISPVLPRRAFTLIELLAVVGVVAVLAALLVPVASKAVGKAEAAQCLSNLRQLHVAYMQEVAENDMTLPFSYYYDLGTSWTEKYAESLGGRGQQADGGAKLAAATGCPSQRKKLRLGANRRTFAINLPLTDNPITRLGDAPPKLSVFSQPAKTVLFADGPIKSATSTKNGLNASDTVDTLHAQCANAAFLDGHVEPVKKERWEAMKGALPTKADSAGTEKSIFWLGV